MLRREWLPPASPRRYLERRQEGNLTLSDLPRGGVRELTEAEIRDLEAASQGKMTDK